MTVGGTAAPATRADVAVVGAGIVGLATRCACWSSDPACGRRPREGADAGRAPDRPQQRGRPRRPLLRAGLPEGPPVPRGQGRSWRPTARARHPHRAPRQARRRARRVGAAAPRAAQRTRRRPTGSPGSRRSGPSACARSSRTPPASAALWSPEHRHRRLPGRRAGLSPTTCGRAAARSRPRARSTGITRRGDEMVLEHLARRPGRPRGSSPVPACRPTGSPR